MRKMLIFFLMMFYCFNSFNAQAESKSTNLIPIHDLMQDPLINQVVISPDGKSIAALYNNNDRIMVLVKDLTSDKSDPAIINVLNHNVKWVRWKSNQRIITGTLVEGGIWNDYYALVVMDKDGKNMRHLISDYKVGSIIDLLPDDPDHILVEELSYEHQNFPEVYKVSVGKEREEVLIQASKFNIDHWITDANGNVAMGETWLNDKKIFEAKMNDGSWKTIYEGNYLKDPLFDPVAIGKTGNAYVLSRHENDKAALYEYNIPTQTFGKQLFKHDLVDIDGAFYSRLKDTVEYATFTFDKEELHFFDNDLSKDYLSAGQALSGATNVIADQSADEKRLIILSSKGSSPGSYYLFDREKKQMTFLGSRYPSLETFSFPEIRCVKYKVRDGMDIYGYLSLPGGFDKSTSSPMVVLVHGGPYVRDKNEFDPWVQFLTNRGYVVFQPNFRGSSGYGAAYWKSSYKQWGLAMEDDVIDGIKILIESKIADKNRICIMGGSYGGYAALMGAAKYPEMFSCAVSIAGVSDLNRFLIDQRFKGNANYYNHILIGDDYSERKAVSPITYADQINCPVFLAHGTEDKTVYYSQSTNMVSALKGEKKDVTFLKLKDETHHLEDIKNRVELFEAIEKFLIKNMNGSPTIVKQ